VMFSLWRASLFARFTAVSLDLGDPSSWCVQSSFCSTFFRRYWFPSSIPDRGECIECRTECLFTPIVDLIFLFFRPVALLFQTRPRLAVIIVERPQPQLPPNPRYFPPPSYPPLRQHAQYTKLLSLFLHSKKDPPSRRLEIAGTGPPTLCNEHR